MSTNNVATSQSARRTTMSPYLIQTFKSIKKLTTILGKWNGGRQDPVERLHTNCLKIHELHDTTDLLRGKASVPRE
jgi:hypothetical protein